MISCSVQARWRFLARSIGINRFVPQENSVLFPHNKSFIDQACSVKMTGYWPRSILRVYGPRLRRLGLETRKELTWPMSGQPFCT